MKDRKAGHHVINVFNWDKFRNDKNARFLF